MSRSAPKARTEQETPDVEEGAPVKINRADGDGQLGIVRSVERHPEQTRVNVEIRDGSEVNTAADRVEVATGVHADLVWDMIGGDDSD